MNLEVFNGTVDLHISLDNKNLPGHDSEYFLDSGLEPGWDTYRMLREVE